jgi:predicted phage terminase large subunit-like protein
MEVVMMTMMDLTRRHLNAAIRSDFYWFVRRAFRELNPTTPFLANWHIRLIAAKLEACSRGEITRLIINVPPRSLESLCASVAFPAWCLGHDPSRTIIAASYSEELAAKHSRDCRNLMTSYWYQNAFPGTRFSSQKQAALEFETTCNGFRLAVSVGGSFTGRGSDLIIIDDPLKADDAISDVQRQRVNNWYADTLYTRLNDKKTGCIILIMQRLHEDDLVGHVLGKERWEHIALPAIAEQDEEHLIETPRRKLSISRSAGEVLHPARESRPVLDNIRTSIGEYNFAGQYQQAPAPLGGGMIKAEWFRRYDPDDPSWDPEDFDQIVQSWDTANKATQLSDFSVGTTWGIKGKNFYLIDVVRKRLAYPDLKRTVIAQIAYHDPNLVLIEDKASGTPLIEDLIANGVGCIKRRDPKQKDKVMRMHAQTGPIEGGHVYLPERTSWLPEYLHELAIFPNGKYDDQVDSTSQFLEWVQESNRHSGLFGFYQHLRAQDMADQGCGLHQIATEVRAEPAEVARWQKQDQERSLRMAAARAVRQLCAACGRPLDSTSWSEYLGKPYHHHCCRKMFRGGS